MSSTEEIAIRLGIDSRAVKGGMTSASNIIENNLQGLKRKFNKFSGDMLGGAVIGFFGSLTSSITDLIKSGVDVLSDYVSKQLYDTIYGVSDRLMDVMSGMHTESNESGRTHESVAAEMDKMDMEESRRIFEAKSAEDRKKESEEILFSTQKEMNLAKARVVEAREGMKELRNLNEDNQLAASEGAKKIADAEAMVLSLRKKNVAAAKDLRKALKEINSDPIPVAEPPGIEQDPRYNGRQFSFRQPDAPSAPSAGKGGIDDYMAKIKSAKDAYKAKTDYSKFGKAVAEAQVEAAKEFVQKVAIVEIKQ